MSHTTLSVFIPAYKGDSTPGPSGNFIEIYEKDTYIGLQFAKGPNSVTRDDDSAIDTFVNIEDAEQIVKAVQEAIAIAKDKLDGKESYYKSRMIHI